MTGTVNRQAVPLAVDALHWAVVGGSGRRGPVVVSLPRKLTASLFDAAHPYPAAISVGPVALAFQASNNFVLAKIDLKEPGQSLIPVAGEALTWQLKDEPACRPGRSMLIARANHTISTSIRMTGEAAHDRASIRTMGGRRAVSRQQHGGRQRPATDSKARAFAGSDSSSTTPAVRKYSIDGSWPWWTSMGPAGFCPSTGRATGWPAPATRSSSGFWRRSQVSPKTGSSMWLDSKRRTDRGGRCDYVMPGLSPRGVHRSDPGWRISR